MLKPIIILFFLPVMLFTQELKHDAVILNGCYKIPFASKGNLIELTVENSSKEAKDNISVAVNKLPEWIKTKTKEMTISKIRAGEDITVKFDFDIDIKAPVGKEETLKFNLTNQSGESWEKEIKITISAPERYELYQNYPNPFNPVTTISYQLPRASKVSIRIYNLLGEEVAALVNTMQEAGYYTPQWNGINLSSGVYIYQLTAKGIDGKEYVQRKKMMLLK